MDRMSIAVDAFARTDLYGTSNRYRLAAVLACLGLIGGITLPLKPAFAASTVYFAGFALRGAAVALKQRFPYSYEIATENTNGVNHIDAILRNNLASFSSPKFNLSLTGLGALTSGQSTSVAFVLNRETIGQEQIANIHKLYIQLSGSVLFFDFHGMKVEASYPVSVEYVDAFNSPPTTEQISQDVRELYFGHTSINILQQYQRVLQHANLGATGGNTLRLTAIKILPNAMAHFPPFLRSNPAEAEEYVAQTFDKALVGNQRVAVLPYVEDAAIGNTMALRFASGRVYSLSIPSSDYDINLTISAFRRFQFRKTTFANGWVYAVYGHIKIFEPLSNTIYLNDTFRDGVAKIIPDNEQYFTSWPVYQDAMLTLFNHATKALSNPKSVWAEKASNNPEIAEELQKVKDLLQSCR